MYEMYPDSWADRPATGDGQPRQPRRRTRKEHSVTPPVVAAGRPHPGRSTAA